MVPQPIVIQAQPERARKSRFADWLEAVTTSRKQKDRPEAVSIRVSVS